MKKGSTDKIETVIALNILIITAISVDKRYMRHSQNQASLRINMQDTLLQVNLRSKYFKLLAQL